MSALMNNWSGANGETTTSNVAPLVSASFLFIWACNYLPGSLSIPRIYLQACGVPLNILEEFSKPLADGIEPLLVCGRRTEA